MPPFESERAALGDRLREAREYLELSQDEVAKRLQVPRSAISLIESGQRRVEALELRELAKLYQRSVASLTGEEAPSAMAADVAHLARAASTLTETDRTELTRFAEFLQSRTAARGAK
jgi:transcriptional regulator with XRE-family HTH domain